MRALFVLVALAAATTACAFLIGPRAYFIGAVPILLWDWWHDIRAKARTEPLWSDMAVHFCTSLMWLPLGILGACTLLLRWATRFLRWATR